MDQQEHAEENYNELYPAPKQELCALLKQFVEDRAKLNISRDLDIEEKRLYPLHIKKNIELYTKYKCKDCTGSHQFIIAGGYASYLANLNSTFTDIDIYIHCNKFLYQGTLNIENTRIRTYRNVTTMSDKVQHYLKPKVQFIQVNFNIGVSRELEESETFRDLMAMYVICKFDLPICRVAVKVSLTLMVKMASCIDASAFDVHKLPSSEERRKKYELRKTKGLVI